MAGNKSLINIATDVYFFYVKISPGFQFVLHLFINLKFL